jgi:hypothetical protein
VKHRNVAIVIRVDRSITDTGAHAGCPDNGRHSFFSGLVGNTGALVALQVAGQQPAFSSDVMSTISGTI